MSFERSKNLSPVTIRGVNSTIVSEFFVLTLSYLNNMPSNGMLPRIGIWVRDFVCCSSIIPAMMIVTPSFTLMLVSA